MSQVLLVAGDTFRAAAAEQLAGWAERSRAEMAAATSPKQRPDALMYSAIDRVRMLAAMHQVHCKAASPNLQEQGDVGSLHCYQDSGKRCFEGPIWTQ